MTGCHASGSPKAEADPGVHGPRAFLKRIMAAKQENTNISLFLKKITNVLFKYFKETENKYSTRAPRPLPALQMVMINWD
jgi:hypothetical protein